MGLFSKKNKLKDKTANEVQASSASNQNTNYWTCAKCGTHNSKSSMSCKDCGAYK